MPKTVLITGASSGIGLATAQQFQRQGWNVVATMRSPDKAPETLTSLERVLCLRLDVTQPETIKAAIAQTLGARVLFTNSPRACQMNAGAAAAAGGILLFLHADTRLPHDFPTAVRQTLDSAHVVAGAFDLGIQGEPWGLRWVEWGVKWRSHLCQMPYGDQTLFLRAETFRAVGGFAELPLLEDMDMVRRLKRMGRVTIAPGRVSTSGRRWEKLGILRTTLLNQLILLAYHLGVSPNRLADWYRDRNFSK